MLINADAKALEWVCCAYLSQDKVAIKEIIAEVDMHSDNQKRFNLPTRLIAKTFVFRLIYGGSAYSYANDPDFREIGGEDFWQKVIDAFYDKYKGLKAWHEKIMFDAKRDRKLTMPTGRVYYYEPEIKFDKVKYPRTKILNYPVQGLGADLMAIARVTLRNRLKGREGVQLINTVHDSIMLDYDEKIWYNNNSLLKMVSNSFIDVPKNFEKLFGSRFNLPMRAELEVGETWGTMKVVEV